MNNIISIVVPIYNCEKYLEKSVDSILASSYGDLEIILVNDGSTDGSGVICNRYAKQDKRVKHIVKPNGGVSTARNAGIEAATGQYISFIDSDDWISPQMYSELHKALTNDNADMVTLCSAVIVAEKGYNIPVTCPSRPIYLTGNHPAEDFWAEYLDQEPLLSMVVWGKLCNREKFFKTRRYAVGRLYEDTLLLPEWYLDCKTITMVPGNHYYYLQRPSSTMGGALTPAKYCQFIDSRFYKINTFYDRGLTDLPYSFDCFLIQGLLKFFEFALWRLDEEERQKWFPEWEKRCQWFNDQEWEIRNGKTTWTRKRRDL
ncbi:MAG: glycosyltransferase [Planctomycetaceae bacterium]|jgi:glycosyltransferase involved in cell wall biosynthesis|nr:glycosyltransferase [Planctomycetaceae bacterium]